MVTLKWGDALSLLLPGAVALFGLTLLFAPPERAVAWFAEISPTAGAGLIVAAAVLGGFLEGATRIGWDRHVLPKPPNVLPLLKDAERMQRYDHLVQNSYKWATFYANSATAALLVGAGLAVHRWGPASVAAFVIATGLFYASWVQSSYFCSYLKRVFLDKETVDAEELPAARDRGPGSDD